MIQNKNNHVFTSESVSEGHPDKVSDQFSDAILDACLAQDSSSRVACETLTTTDNVILAGEITTNADIDIDAIVRSVISDIGYTEKGCGFDAETVKITNLLHAQSADISLGVTAETSLFGEQGAGDQGMMFGYACDETPQLMPAAIMYSHMLLRKATELRKSGKAPFLRPDSKSQVSIEYNSDNKPVRISNIVMSHQHREEVTREELEAYLIENVIHPVLDKTGLLDDNTEFFINPTGRFCIGGPAGDTGLTGRKIIVDTYGGMGRHGGGAFSGKDPSKVDRSAAYMARYVAKNLVANKLCSRCEVELAYAIGVPRPVSILIDSFGTSALSNSELTEIVEKNFNLSPAGIVKTLDLLRPIYRQYDNYGHFCHSTAPWEQTFTLVK